MGSWKAAEALGGTLLRITIYDVNASVPRAKMRSESEGGKGNHGLSQQGKRSEICRAILMALRYRT